MEYLMHRTTDGQRWDEIAWAFYGDASKIGLLIAANPDIDITTRLPGGLWVRVPMIEEPAVTENLPPWKR